MTIFDNVKTTDDGENLGFIQHVNLDGGAGKPAEVSLVDGSGDGTGNKDNRFDVDVSDPRTFSLLTRILKEMKKTNLYLSDMANIGFIDDHGIID